MHTSHLLESQVLRLFHLNSTSTMRRLGLHYSSVVIVSTEIISLQERLGQLFSWAARMNLFVESKDVTRETGDCLNV